MVEGVNEGLPFDLTAAGLGAGVVDEDETGGAGPSFGEGCGTLFLSFPSCAVAIAAIPPPPPGPTPLSPPVPPPAEPDFVFCCRVKRKEKNER